MHLPRRSVKNIQPLPSIYTTFPVNPDSTGSSGEHSGSYLLGKIEDGIQLVPLERSEVLSAPILSPVQDEKEVCNSSQQMKTLSHKPLPQVPTSQWARLSKKQRIFVAFFVLSATLLTIGLSLLALRNHYRDR
jgi:hypothetical protein